MEGLMREITTIWQTPGSVLDETDPLSDAANLLQLIEQSIWPGVPETLRRISHALKNTTGKPLPYDCAPIELSTWIGGDRVSSSKVNAGVTLQIARRLQRLAM